MTTYVGGWEESGKEQMMKDFDITEETLNGVTILLAGYDTPDYEGYAFVLYEKAGQLYEVNGSHCSCNGLEGQWEPEETTVEVLKHRATKGNFNYSGVTNKQVLEVIKEFEGRKPKGE